ncbi:Hypothetical predicted protein [Mytilus galloprovincialis]|uniref:Uncharacterized protein n=1 Tax=Mytilus galloprovincialis TaxID=29158 RepID=A0A8B6GF93_MYTGA|nr:Hypothetical predicted protein [Mytilus galloprovincialis]
MRKRQQLFLTHDMIQNEIMLKLSSGYTEISAGSLAEGLDIRGSDIDIMYVINDVDVIRDVKNIKHQTQRTTLVMETDNEYPGFTRLRLLAGGERESYFTPPDCFEVTRKGLYVSVNKFIILARLSDISQCLKLLNTTEDLIQSKSSSFIVDVCKYHHTEISQYAAQLLPTPLVTTERYNIHKHCHKHLQDGIKADAVSGWLLYASFYYVTGQFSVTLRLTDYVLSRCSPDMILLVGQHSQDRHVNYYRNHIHSTMTLRDKMKMAVVNNVRYVQHSSLIPSGTTARGV